MRPARHGFSLIELLLVMSVIAILGGLVVVAVPAAGRAMKRSKTAVIIATVKQALALTTANTASAIKPSEHPLANSKPPRLAFLRVGGGAVATAGDALRARDGMLSDESRRLRDDDTFAAIEVPHAYGVRRARLGVLGGQLSHVTEFISFPPKSGIYPPPYTTASYAQFVIAPAANTLPSENKAAIDYALGGGSALGELTKLGALVAPPNDSDRILGDRLIAIGPGKPRWKPGLVNDGVSWRPYRLRGAALYDAWGRELLYALDGDVIRLTSAGTDGVLRWSPGKDGVFDTPADASAPLGDDQDGSRDNIGDAVTP